MNLSKLSDNQQTALLLATLVLGAFLSQGCTTINIIFSGTDSGPRPMVMGDAGVPMGDAAPLPFGDAGPVPTVDAGTDSGPSIEVDGGTDAAVIVEIDAGSSDTIVIEPYNMRQSTILVAGHDVWQNVASFRVTSTIETELTDVGVVIDGDPADAHELAIAVEGVIAGWGVLPAGVNTYTNMTLGTPLPLTAGEPRVFQVWTRIPEILPGAAVAGAVFDGVPRSGDRFRMGIYHAMFRSGADAEWLGAIWGNQFQIRKTRPTVTRQSLSSTTLSNGLDMDLYRFQVSADAAGSVAFHSIAFDIVGSGVTLTNFRVRRGSTDISLADAFIVDETSANLAGTGSITVGPSTPHMVVIGFLYEQTVTGSGNVYTLHATASDVVAGDYVSLNFHRTMNGATGYLLDDPIHSSLDVSAWGSAGTVPPIAAGFIWSDLSEVPHSDFYGCCGGSRDWTDGLYIEDLTQTQTLSR